MIHLTPKQQYECAYRIERIFHHEIDPAHAKHTLFTYRWKTPEISSRVKAAAQQSYFDSQWANFSGHRTR